jgi:UPF0755 protein
MNFNERLSVSMKKLPYTFWIKLCGTFFLGIIILVTAAAFVPKQFPVGTVIKIQKNSSLSSIAIALEEKHVINSAFLFKVAVALLHGQGRIAAGSYAFNEPQNLWTVVRRLVRGDQGLTAIKITIPEGATVDDISWILLRRIPNFDAPYFLKIAHDYEGYLFPDTYYFYPTATASEIFERMRSNFNVKFQALLMDVMLSHRRPADIVTMASILEREATSTTDRGIISGILWKRLDEGMPLQVDSTLVYVTQGDSYVSINDTKLDSPYNTYKNKGLPKGPIANPGLNSLRAAAQPVKTPYYYYLSDLSGMIHYATTFAGHQINRERYLRR